MKIKTENEVTLQFPSQSSNEGDGCMKKKVMIGICVLLAIVLLVPIPMRLKDGGTVVYRAVLYQVEDVHRLGAVDTAEDEYLEGMIVRILGMEVYNSVE